MVLFTLKLENGGWIMGRGQLGRHVLICLLVAMNAMTLFGCKQKNEEISTHEEKDEIVVGFSMGTLMEDRWISDRDIFIAEAQKVGITVIVNNANNDSNLQYEQVQDMLDQGIDVLVIAPNDCFVEARCVEAAKEKDIPVISYDRLVSNADVDVYISFDHTKVGVLMASYLVEHAPEGGYIIVNGSDTDNNSKMINDGAMSVLQPYIDDKKIEILDQTWVYGWKRETAYDFVADSLTKNKDKVKAILCGNDSMAWGVIDALSEAQIAEQVVVVGQDADLVACQRIVQGKQALTIYKPIKNLVKETVEVCQQLANGEKITGQGTINDGTYEVPYIYIDVTAVTKDNIDDTVIKDGFHLYEDVYQTADK
jgi:D-xylose transport system substrate-binding protein